MAWKLCQRNDWGEDIQRKWIRTKIRIVWADSYLPNIRKNNDVKMHHNIVKPFKMWPYFALKYLEINLHNKSKQKHLWLVTVVQCDLSLFITYSEGDVGTSGMTGNSRISGFSRATNLRWKCSIGSCLIIFDETGSENPFPCSIWNVDLLFMRTRGDTRKHISSHSRQIRIIYINYSNDIPYYISYIHLLSH